MRELEGLRHISEEIRDQGGAVFAISTDRWDQIRLFGDESEGGMVYISDPDRRIIGAYGLKDSTLGKDIARPASFLLDGDGRVVWRHLPDDWRIRMGADAYLEVYNRLREGGED